MARILLVPRGMSEQADQLKQRTRQFTLDVIELTKAFPTAEPGLTIKRQLLKAATSVAFSAIIIAVMRRQVAGFAISVSIVGFFASCDGLKSPTYPAVNKDVAITTSRQSPASSSMRRNRSGRTSSRGFNNGCRKSRHRPARGGLDAPSNMQWQTVEAAKQKDKTERRGCR
ncbi:MAG: hypothetical protein HY047_11495 [Acidobacteria bacterium]|nr:hypothetical protein [Acidobacteriota bacterium]